MFCNSCGQPLDPVAQHCTRCGAPRPVAYMTTSTIPHNVTAAGLSGEGLRKAKIIVALASVMAGAVALTTLQAEAASIAIVALAVFAIGWSAKSVKMRYKTGFVIVSLILVFAVNAVEIWRQAAVAVERERTSQEADAKKRAADQLAARQAENAFKSMTPAQHLSAAQSELHVGASEDQVADGMKQLDALNGTPIEGRAKALRARYEAEQAQADKASAATQEREDAAAKEGLRITYAKTLENNLLDEYMDANVDAIGPGHTTLRITYLFATRVYAYKISNSGEWQSSFKQMRAVGFHKFVLTNDDQSWTWKLDE